MTSGSKHTPGPWQVEIPHNGYVQVIGGIDGDSYDDGSPRVIYTHVCDVIDNDDEQLNARLIVAAPELLSCLEDLLAFDRVERPAVRIKPVGAPGSTARITQDKLIALEDAALKTIHKARFG